MKIGETIKYLRQEKGFKQMDFANKSEISQTYLSQIEADKKEPTIGCLEKLSTVLNIPLAVIFFLSLDQNMVAEEKRELYQRLIPTVKNIVKEIYM